MMKLFFTAFLQVALVSANTYFIANLFWPGIVIAGFFISFLWASNVKKISIGNKIERLIYSSGAMIGCITGVIIGKVFG